MLAALLSLGAESFRRTTGLFCDTVVAENESWAHVRKTHNMHVTSLVQLASTKENKWVFSLSFTFCGFSQSTVLGFVTILKHQCLNGILFSFWPLLWKTVKPSNDQFYYWTKLTIGVFLFGFGWVWSRWWRRGAQAQLGVVVLEHVNSLTNLLECPCGLGLARLLSCVPGYHIPIAVAGWAIAHLLFVGAIAAMATITTGSHVVNRLRTQWPFRELCKNLHWTVFQ